MGFVGAEWQASISLPLKTRTGSTRGLLWFCAARALGEEALRPVSEPFAHLSERFARHEPQLVQSGQKAWAESCTSLTDHAIPYLGLS